ncbi:cation diffusion facilitator family transporter [Luteimonas terricola]|uniref:Cobalt transporter n=1 Tax=Luteimonas terricola TaxID=645597 RepID=A0ABQ2EDH5_9GAMM|nr:cation diffusion facilitator family transporter [Luteimonas terricola]GGK07049.1 cobalt transporter [Luteimonas terricola]
MHGHHGDHGHRHHHAPAPGSATRTFAIITLVNLAYTVLEAAYGFMVNSLALLSDALHNLGDVLGLAMAWGAAVIAQWPATERHTYGWRRATLLSPLANAVLLVGLSGALAWEALRRMGAPPEVPGMTIIVVASIGIAVNLGTALMVRGGHGHDLNRRGAYLHLMADAAISLATVVAGAGMLAWGWAWLDPATALLVGVVVAVGAIGLLRDSFNAAMDAVPPGIDTAEVRDFIAGQPGVASVHHLHIWSLGAGGVAMTAHLVRPQGDDDDDFMHAIGEALQARFGINHATLQVERGGGACHCHAHG